MPLEPGLARIDIMDHDFGHEYIAWEINSMNFGLETVFWDTNGAIIAQ